MSFVIPTSAGGFKACTRRVEVPAQNIAFVHPLIGKEPIGCFGVGPILARERNALSDPASHPDQKLTKPFTKTRIPEDVLANFPVDWKICGNQLGFSVNRIAASTSAIARATFSNFTA